MECKLPSPAVGFFRGETGIVEPPLVEEFHGTVRQPAPRERWNGINDFSQSGFRLHDLLERFFHRRLWSLSAHCYHRLSHLILLSENGNQRRPGQIWRHGFTPKVQARVFFVPSKIIEGGFWMKSDHGI